MTRRLLNFAWAALLGLPILFAGCSRSFDPVGPDAGVISRLSQTPTPTASSSATPAGPSPTVTSPAGLPTSTPTSPAPTATSIVAPPNGFTAVQSDNLSCARFYERFRGSGDDNVFFSPFSIVTALAMVDEGAAGNTKAEIEAALSLQSNDALRRQGFRDLIAVINAPGRSFELSTSNNLWVQEDFQVLPSYRNVVVNDYSALASNLDFLNNPNGSSQTINAAVSQQTNGRILDLVPPSAILPDTKVILTNAIYFKADWESPFEALQTYFQPFTLSNGTSLPVSMMHQVLSAAIEDYHGLAKVLELPYEGREVSAFIILPPLGQMPALEAGVTPALLESWFAGRTPPVSSYPVALALPKFKFSTSYDLNQTLEDLGIRDAFVPRTADLSGIDGILPSELFISKVLHKAFVAVDEKGTEAAAATAVLISGITSVGVTPPPPVPFIADHPFLFVIRENSTGAILFLGRISDPTKE